MQREEHSLQHKAFGSFALLTAALFGVQLAIGLAITLRTWNAAFQHKAFSWDRDDAFTILTYLLLQSVIGAYFLSRLRRSKSYLLHVGKGILVVLSGFLIAAPLTYILLRFAYKPLPTPPPSFVFMLIFFLGHRIPLVGVVLGGFAAATLQWLHR